MLSFIAVTIPPRLQFVHLPRFSLDTFCNLWWCSSFLTRWAVRHGACSLPYMFSSPSVLAQIMVLLRFELTDFVFMPRNRQTQGRYRVLSVISLTMSVPFCPSALSEVTADVFSISHVLCPYSALLWFRRDWNLTRLAHLVSLFWWCPPHALYARISFVDILICRFFYRGVCIKQFSPTFLKLLCNYYNAYCGH